MTKSKSVGATWEELEDKIFTNLASEVLVLRLQHVHEMIHADCALAPSKTLCLIFEAITFTSVNEAVSDCSTTTVGSSCCLHMQCLAVISDISVLTKSVHTITILCAFCTA